MADKSKDVYDVYNSKVHDVNVGACSKPTKARGASGVSVWGGRGVVGQWHRALPAAVRQCGHQVGGFSCSCCSREYYHGMFNFKSSQRNNGIDH